VTSSSADYFQNVVKFWKKDSIAFNAFIFNSKDYFDVKFLTVHSENIIPELRSFGKVANQSEISVASFQEPTGRENLVTSNIYIAAIIAALLSILMALTSNYSATKLRKDELKKVSSNFTKMREQLEADLREITEKLPQRGAP